MNLLWAKCEDDYKDEMIKYLSLENCSEEEREKYLSKIFPNFLDKSWKKSFSALVVGNSLDNCILENFLEYYFNDGNSDIINKYVREQVSMQVKYHKHSYLELINPVFFSGFAYSNLESISEFVYELNFPDFKSIFAIILQSFLKHYSKYGRINVQDYLDWATRVGDIKENMVELITYFVSKLGYKASPYILMRKEFIELFSLIKILMNVFLTDSLIDSSNCLNNDIEKLENIKLAFKDLTSYGFRTVIGIDENPYKLIHNQDEYKEMLLNNAEEISKGFFRNFGRSLMVEDIEFLEINRILREVRCENFGKNVSSLSSESLIKYILSQLTIYLLNGYKERSSNLFI